MKPKLILCLALILSGGLVGCSTVSNSTGLKKSADGYGVDEITSHIFGVQGKIVSLNNSATTLESITLELIKPLPTALGWIPYKKPGEIIVIRFDEPLSKLGGLKLAVGSIVKVAFGNGIQSQNPNDLGSNFSWLYIEKNGKFYDSKGEIVNSDPGENLPFILRGGVTKPDAIDRLVRDLSATSGLYLNGFPSGSDLPPSAAPSEMVAEAFRQADFDSGRVTSYQILEVRRVQVEESTIKHNYTAVLADTNLGQKIILMQHVNGEGLKHGYWWRRIYDADGLNNGWH